MPDRGVELSLETMRERARTLLDRVQALDAEVVRLAGAPGQGLAVAGIAPPAARENLRRATWPLAEQAGADLQPFDHRPDDAAVRTARAGAAFMALLGIRRPGEPPSPAALRQAVSRLSRRPILRRTAIDGAAPDVSIVIPVFGQLAHTLNCLDGLLGHVSRYTVETIVVDDASPDDSLAALQALAAALPGLRVLPRVRNAGFIAACNAGAELATGRFIVLLNNDSRVVDGWLDALIDGFGRLPGAGLPEAGLIGSKLLYPDLRLQECGGILWRDGTAWNFGRNHDPNHPSVCHARETDYVSGASIALPAALWRQLGGFDAHFAPAYAEDADLAMRVRAAGKTVWVQPRSLVIHDEGTSSGTDLSAGTKAHQVINNRKLFLRWQDTLLDHPRAGSEPWFARERGVRRRALVIDASTPTPDQDAGSGTTMRWMGLLRGLGYKVHFVPQDNFLFQPGPTGALQAAGIECAYAPYDVEFSDYIRRHGAIFDIALVFRPEVMAAVHPALKRHAPQAMVMFDNHDLHYLRAQREAELVGDQAAVARAASSKTEQLALIEAADVTLTVSTFERDLLAREVPRARVVVQAFPYPVIGTQADFARRCDFVFLGGYRHPPNVDAAEYFVHDILPRIRLRLPLARAIIAGANPTPAVRALAGPGVAVTGFVADLPPLLDAARVFVCPVRYGAGVKGKVIAAMAHGLPAVATSCGAEGAQLVHDQDLLVADDPDSFAAACCSLHEDPALWTRLSQAGMAFVERVCSMQAGLPTMRAAIDAGWRRKLRLDED